MTQLPSVAVIGAGLPSALALAALVDGGLDAQGVCSADLEPDALDVLSMHGLEGRLRRMDAAVGVVRLPGGDGSHGQFEIVADGTSLGRFDAVVVADGEGEGPTFAEVAPGMIGPARRFGGVFDPNSDGVYLVGAAGLVGGNGRQRARSGVTAERGTVALQDVAAIGGPAWAQGRWVGEYLRGRYLLPARSVMLTHPGLPRRRFGWERHGVDGYLARLGRELRRGRARAAAAGYPLPLPPFAAPPGAVATKVRQVDEGSPTGTFSARLEEVQHATRPRLSRGHRNDGHPA